MMYEKAAELRPDDHELAVAAATAMRQAARYDDSERWYRKAVALKPTVLFPQNKFIYTKKCCKLFERDGR